MCAQPQAPQFGFPAQSPTPSSFGQPSPVQAPLPGRPCEGVGDIWAVNGPSLSTYTHPPPSSDGPSRSYCGPPGYRSTPPPDFNSFMNCEQPNNFPIYAPSEPMVPSFAPGICQPPPAPESLQQSAALSLSKADLSPTDQALSPTIDVDDDALLPDICLGSNSLSADCNTANSGGNDSDSEHIPTMPSCRLHARLRKTRLRPENSLLTGKRKYRCELCTMTLEAWVENNGTNPDSPHKTELLKVVGMTRKQLNYWFANRRRMERQAAKDPNRARMTAIQRCSSEQSTSADAAALAGMGNASWLMGDSGFVSPSSSVNGLPTMPGVPSVYPQQTHHAAMFNGVFSG